MSNNSDFKQYDVKTFVLTKDNPRNSEGSFMRLASGRIIFIYSGYTGAAGDHDTCDLFKIYSDDNGETWSDVPEMVVSHGDSLNVMSVSLLRLQDGRIMLCYCKKDKTHMVVPDCMPYVSFSDDEAETWSEPKCIMEPKTINVVNNDRIVQLESGRILVPVALHRFKADGNYDWRSISVVMYSDDNGKTFKESQDWILPPQKDTCGLQEPGVIELEPNKVMLWSRTNSGCQYVTFSDDGGDTWDVAQPSEFISPCSPLSMKRNPFTNELIAVWNDRSERFAHLGTPEESSWTRTPLVIARSKDNGKTWTDHTALETPMDIGFCYIAIYFLSEKSMLLSYNVIGTGVGAEIGLQSCWKLKIRRVDF